MFERLRVLKPHRPNLIAFMWNLKELKHYVKSSLTDAVVEVTDFTLLVISTMLTLTL